MRQPGVPRVFHLTDVPAWPNHPLARSARIVTRESTGSQRLYAGMFWNEPGAIGGWSFRDDDPDEGRTVDGIEFGANDVVFFAAGHTYLTEVIGDEPVQVFYVMAPAPAWMAPLGPE